MHMKRYSMPRSWPLGRKVNTFVITPAPGPHSKKSSIALRVIIRDMLGYAETAGEVSRIIRGGGVLVDKKAVLHDNYPVGLMDVVEFPSAKKYFRVVPGLKGIEIKEIDARQASRKLCAIKRKTT